MSENGVLEQRVRKTIIRRLPTEEVLSRVREGGKFIVVTEDFDLSHVPQGYTLIDMNHKEDSFRALVPQSLLFYMANPGEGDSEDALEQIADFYDEAEDLEDEMIENGGTSVQQANWATHARSAYQTYLINALVRTNRRGRKDAEGEPAPEFDQKTLEKLDLNDPYVSQRVKAIAAVALGKTAEEVKSYGIDDVLRHVTIKGEKEKVMEQLSAEEFQRVTCWAGSHYEIRPEFRGQGYEIEYRHDQSHMIGKKTTIKDKTQAVLDARIGDLEREIAEYRRKKHNGEVGRHDAALFRAYVNLVHIAHENPKAQLDIKPPERENE